MSKLAKEFLFYTFLIMIVCWGNIVAAVVLIVFSHIFVKSNAVKRIMY